MSLVPTHCWAGTLFAGHSEGPFWYLRRRLQTGPHSGFRVPLGGGLPGLAQERFPKHASPSSHQPSVGSALQTIEAHASDLQDALLQVSMPAIAGRALGRPKATPATRLTVDFWGGRAGIGLCQCSGPGGSVYGPTSQPVNWRTEQGFQCDHIACLRATKVLLTLAMCRNAWPHIFRGHRLCH